MPDTDDLAAMPLTSLNEEETMLRDTVRQFAQQEIAPRVRAMDELRERTVHRGVHLVLPAEQRTDVRSLAPEALLAHYAGWQVERGPRACGRWFLAIKP